MSAELAATEVTSRLADLALRTTAVEPTSRGVDAALHGRAATLGLACQILEDANSRTPTRGRALREGRFSPQLGLQIALHSTVGPTPRQSPLDVHASSRPGSLPRAWEAIGALATEAHRHWSTAAQLPRVEVGRSAAGDAAVMVLAVVHLDPHLHRAAQRAGRHDVVDALDAGRGDGLAFHAERLLRSTPTVAWSAAAAPKLEDLHVVPVSDGASLSAGLRRIGEQLDAGAAISPQHTALLLTAQMRMSLILADHARVGARATGDPRLLVTAETMTTHAHRLAETGGARGRQPARDVADGPAPGAAGRGVPAPPARHHEADPTGHRATGAAGDRTGACAAPRR
ncbi:hypothetical protein MO973_09620 [Paenibacillus sp. TRM 82003]|uniref:hypothetical protein n=1 Tax=Kineococcus sp. TRM81007 TaxID=2925831 RepID=UPI001F58AA85|nr:hypothetical protein [Kineococcus sp. TRM81007]MCI2238105.1 hypothetical protein [Kineococcus sp. TRM81007]MCI3920490.1 hypothetical protein [Paenibacillus sp. TRM 82003]